MPRTLCFLRSLLFAASIAAPFAFAIVGCRREAGSEPETKKTETREAALGAWFVDSTAKSGIDFTCRTGEEADRYTILESLGSGVGLIDFDNDGLLDVFFAGGGTFQGDRIVPHPCRLYKNLGGWKFRDVTAETGLDRIDFYSHGVAVADVDRDGWSDLLVTGYGGLALFRNEAGSKGRTFRRIDLSAMGDARHWNASAGFADLAGSGYPDLYVCRYCDWSFANDPPCQGKGGAARDVCGPQKFRPQPHALFRNRNGTLESVQPEWLRKDGYGLGVVIADLDTDGRPDVYVGNDAYDNFLYANRGAGRMEEIGAASGTARDGNGLYNGSMGTDVGDFEGTGRPAVFVSNFQGDHHALYRNLGNLQFLYHTHGAGIAALGQSSVGFGTQFVDVDNDGWEDLVVVDGHVLRHPVGSTLKQKPVLLHNVDRQGRRFFANVSNQGGEFFRTAAVGRGLAVGDLDNDGWPDLVVTHSNAPAKLLRNASPSRGKNQWIGFRLQGKGARDIVGSSLVLESGSAKRTRFVKGGGSYLSASDPRILVGLGENGRCDRATVRWSWGETQTWEGLAPGRYWELREGERQPRAMPQAE